MEALKGVSLSWTNNLMVIMLFGIMLFWEKIPKSKVCGEKKKKRRMKRHLVQDLVDKCLLLN